MTKFVLLFLLFGISKGIPNTPPQISFDREWTLTEDEPVGSVVTRIRVIDAENDDVNITIGNPSSSAFQGLPDGASYFTIDKDKRVLLAKPLRGLAGRKFLVGIIASDGNVPKNRNDAWVSVRRGGTDPVNNYIPSSFSASFFPNSAAISPPLRVLHEDDKNLGPPLLHLDPFTVWVVSSDAEVGSKVTDVDAENLRDSPLKFSLSPNEVIEIDPHTGRVSTATQLGNKVGNHSITVNVSDDIDYITEDIVLRVQPPEESQGIRIPPSSPKDLEGPKFSSPPSVESSLPPNTDGGSYGSAEPKGIVPENGVKSTEKSSSPGWISLSVVGVLVPVLGAAVFARWWWRKNKSVGALKESSVSYNEKRGSVGHIDTTRRVSVFDGLFSFGGYRRRAESNGYEGDIKIPDVPNRGVGGESRRKSSKGSTGIPGETDDVGADKWEFPRHKIKVLGILGEGCFGQVWKCEALDMVEEDPTTVAVKTLKESAGQAEQNDLLQELKVLKSLTFHPNVVSLLGCCTEKDPVFVILEYMAGGKLQSYLRSSRAGHSYGNLHGVSSSLTPRDLTIFALQVSRGMDFLSKNGIIHRDLAARNILVGENKVCKVADFGFARDVANNHVYERKSDGRLPIRWMAPESLFDNLFTTKSDVWSFGILLWEIVTLGSTPYPGVSAAEVMRRVKDGYRLEKPDHCRREIYNIMYYCWDFDQRERPSFPELVKSLEALIMTEVDYIQLEKFPDHSYYNFNSVSTSGELL